MNWSHSQTHTSIFSFLFRGKSYKKKLVETMKLGGEKGGNCKTHIYLPNGPTDGKFCLEDAATPALSSPKPC